MVAVLWCDVHVLDRLERVALDGHPDHYSEAWRRGEWEGSAPHVTLIVYENEVRWLGQAQGGRPITSRDRIVTCSALQEIEPLPLSELREKLPSRHQGLTDRIGILPPAGGAAVLTALKEIRPQLAAVIDRLAGPMDIEFPSGAPGEILSQERDGVGLVLEVAGIGRQVLRAWARPATVGVPFLSGLPRGSHVMEDHQVIHDTERFLDWSELDTNELAWRTFTDGDRRVFVMNANRTPVEHTLGVDVVYFNESSQSFVMIQYKKMSKEKLPKEKVSRGERYSVGYRPDSKLDDELKRMTKIDAACSTAAGEFRLLATPCWLKLCLPEHRLKDPAALAAGMYLAREHFVELRQVCKGVRGGTRFTYDNVPRYLNNTQFIALVRDGWIGSRGAGTDQVKDLIRESLATGHAVVFGAEQASS